MTRKVYRTAQGKVVDLGRLQLQNENVRAVGNMKVNARGDLLDSNNRPINSRNEQVARQYRRQTTNVTNEPVKTSSRAAKEIPPPPEDFEDDFQRPEVIEAAPAAQTEPAQGLAAAIARARSVRQEPLRTAQEIAQQEEGVRKI